MFLFISYVRIDFKIILTYKIRTTNIKVRTETGINTMESYIELRRRRRLEKIANMNPDRIPRMLLGAWLPYARKTGKPFKQFEMRTYVH